MNRLASNLRRRFRTPSRVDDLLAADDARYLSSGYDDSVPLPASAEGVLREDNPRLQDLSRRYSALDLPVNSASRWNQEAVETFVDLPHFRGESLFTWHYRESIRVTELKYFLLLRDVEGHDHLGLLERFDEDGLFGAWRFMFSGRRPISRDLLDSVGEISFLDRALGLGDLQDISILDIGAGYGRLAHRMASALPNIADYCCVDAIATSTFLSEYYLAYRDVAPPARVVALDEVDELETGSFDLALNIHSFSECTYAAVEWWVAQLVRLEVPRFFLIPNEPEGLLTMEADGSRLDFAPLLKSAGYRLVLREPMISDVAIRDLLQLHDHFHLFERT